MTIMVGKALRVKIRPQDEGQRKGGLVATDIYMPTANSLQ